MSIISLLVALIVIGVVIWAVTTFIPMDGNIKMIIRVVGVVIALLIVLNAFGIIGSLSSIKVPTVK